MQIKPFNHKPICVLIILFLSAVSGIYAQPPAGEAEMRNEYRRLETLWMSGNDYPAAAKGLLDFRKKYPTSPDIDFMLADSLCRVPATVGNGYQHFRWMISKYNFDEPSRRLIKGLLDQARIKPNRRVTDRIRFQQGRWGWQTAGVEGNPNENLTAFETVIKYKTFDEVRNFFILNPVSNQELNEVLDLAVRRENAEGLKILNLLIEKGADVKGEPGRRAFVTAVKFGTLEAIQLLIKNGLDLKNKGYLIEEVVDRIDGLKILQIFKQNNIEFQPWNGSALLKAARKGSSEIVQFLLDNLDNNAGVEERYEENNPRAITQWRGVLGNIELVDGYEVGSTSLMFAAARSDSEGTSILKLLLSRGASVEGFNGSKALLGAASAGNTENLRLLIKAEVNVNAGNEIGTTALMAATEIGATDAVELLLREGANCELINLIGVSAVNLAEVNRLTDITKLFIAARSKTIKSQ